MKYLFNILICLLMVAFTSQDLFAGFESKADGEYVTISGKVTKVSADWFQLKTSGNTILVEMDDYDWDADGYKLVTGDQVVVSGRIDDDFLEKKKIEAGTVYVKNIDTYFYASSFDEEGGPYVPSIVSYLPTLPENAYVDIQGTVTMVDGREFTVNTGLRSVKVDTSEMSYNPMDHKGFTKINKGDRVRVSGVVDKDFFAGKEIVANFVAEYK